MRSAIPTRDMKAIGDALALAGIPSRTPVGGELEGSLSLHDHKLILRVHCIGKAILYDPTEGTLNLRPPKVTWDVPFGRGWTVALARLVHAFLQEPAGDDSVVTPPPATNDDAPQAHLILARCARGHSQSQISHELGCARTTVRKTVEGVQHRTEGERHWTDPYLAHLDPLRLDVLRARDDARIPDDRMVKEMRKRLGDPPKVAPPDPPTPKKKSPTFSLTTVHTIFDMWSNGASLSKIADALALTRHNANIRVHRVIVGEHRIRGVYERLYRVVDGTNIDSLRHTALATRASKNITPDDAELDLRARLDAGR